jgi:hypothetical protein
MSNMLADFPADTFDIVAFCDCGHRADLDLEALPPTMTVDQLRARLRCQVCGGGDVSIRIVWHGGVDFRHDWGGSVGRSV